MMEQWNAMSERERLLVSVAGILTILVLGYFLLARPLATYVQDSGRALEDARRTYGQIAAGAREIKALGEAGDNTRKGTGETLRVVVARTAREAGVALSRIQPGSDGALTVWVENVPSPMLYRWIQVMDEAYGIAPVKVIAQKSTSEGRLRVQLQFGGAA